MKPKKWLLAGLPLVVAGLLLWALKTPGDLGSRKVLEIDVRLTEGRVEIEDSDGFRLTFDEAPKRVLPCNSSIVDLLLLLIDPVDIVAIPEQADIWSLVADSPEAFKDHPRLHRYLAEPVVVHQPDLVIVSQFNTPDTNSRLREMGIPLLRLPVRDDMEDVFETLSMLAKIFRAEDRLELALTKLRERRRRLENRVVKFPPSRVLFYSNYGTGGWTFGNKSTIDSFVTMAGLKNAGAASGRSGSRGISFEEILTLDPDLIVVSASENGGKGATRTLLENTAALQGLSALREGAIIELSPRLSQSSSQEMLTAAETLAAAWSQHKADRLLPARESQAGK